MNKREKMKGTRCFRRNMLELVRTLLVRLFPDSLFATIDLVVLFLACLHSTPTKEADSHTQTGTSTGRSPYQLNDVITFLVGKKSLVQEDPARTQLHLSSRKGKKKSVTMYRRKNSCTWDAKRAG